MNNDLVKDLLAEEWGLTAYSSEEQEKYLEEIGSMIYQSVLLRCYDLLLEEERDEMEKIVDAQGSDMNSVLAFFQEKLPSYHSIVSEEASKLKSNFVTTRE